MQQPLVSVVMPVLNGEKFVGEAIESILNQSYKNFEFIILNDASSDNTINVLKSYNDSRIRILDFSARKGLNALLNTGIAEAKGDYIMRMDADDISLTHRMSRQVTYLESHPEISICSSWVQNFNDQQVYEISKGYSEDIFLKLELLYRPGFAHPSVTYRRQIFENGIRYRIFHADDYDLWTQLSFEYNFYKIPELLLKYRIHKDQFTKINQDKIARALFPVQLTFLKRNGIVLSSTHLKIHQALTVYKYTYSEFFLFRTVIYYRELEYQLGQSVTLRSNAVKPYIDDQLYSICSHFTKNGINALLIYIKERRVTDIFKIMKLMVKSIYLVKKK